MIGKFAMQLIRDGKTNKETLAKIKAVFPESRTTLQCITWYRARMRSKGEMVPTNRTIARTLCVATLLLSGCASPRNEEALRAYTLACTIGNSAACVAADNQRAVNTDQANANTRLVTALILLPLAIVALAAAGGGGSGGGMHPPPRMR